MQLFRECWNANSMITSEQIRAARALLRMEQRQLAELSGVSVRTIARFELLPGPLKATFQTGMKIKEALESRGIEFREGGVTLQQSKPAEE